MSRYIDYDAIDYRNDKMHDKSSDFIDGVIYMAQRIEEAPSIDIEPKRGEWERVSADKYVQHAYHYYRCSECGYDHIGKTNFCPNCGAKMSNAPNASNTLETLEKGETE